MIGVRAAAKDFIRKRIGEEQLFVAAHVRPYPDGCIMVWIKGGQGDQTVGWCALAGLVW